MKARAKQILSASLVTAGIAVVMLLLLALRLHWIKLDAFWHSGQEEVASEVAENRTLCTLTPEKLREAGIHESTAEVRAIREERTVPGSITYDAARHLEIKSPGDCAAVQVLAEPGQNLKEGAPLVVLSSSAVGLARDEVLQREADLAIARKELAWAFEISANIRELTIALKQRPDLPELEKSLEGKKLGDYREKVIGAYSKLIFTELAIESAESLTGQGGVAKRVTQERRSARETAAAVFAGACETAGFDALRSADKAQAAAEKAERLLAVSREHLAVLVGPFGDASASAESDQKRLSEFTVRAPFAGRVEERQVVKDSRLAAGSPLFSLADTREMRASAEIHERDWKALDMKPGENLTIRVPALDEAVFPAKVRYVGSQVSLETHSIPLVADVDNSHGRFKAGMFVWVQAPIAAERSALVVPPGALMRHDGEAFVFVPAGKNAFRRVTVETGLETSAGIEITAGLKAGDRVIDQGAFVLKSELLLEREE